MKKVIIQLGTLTCPSCMQKIEQGLSQQTGVEKVTVLFNASKVKVEINEKDIQPEDLSKKIEALGYNVEGIKVKELA